MPRSTKRKTAHKKPWRYMDLYGVTGELAKYVARKYKSHGRNYEQISLINFLNALYR